MKLGIFNIGLTLLILFSCKEENKIKIMQKEKPIDKLDYDRQIQLIRKNTSKDSVFSFDQDFINMEILNGKYKVDLHKYLTKDCFPIRLSKLIVIENFEGFQNIGDINNDKKDDFVFVLNPLNYCEEGQSYYFSDSKITRIYTESNCCHPNSIFSIGDIDEDGKNEIGQYYSSCASRFKRINVWTLKGNEWKEIGEFAYTLNDKYQQFEDFDKLYKKKSKGVFQFLEITDVDVDGRLISEWKTVKMK